MKTIKEVLAMVEELEKESKKTVAIPHYYKRNGKMLRRSYDDYVETERYKELWKMLHSEETKVFECSECGEMCGYFDLETWVCDFEKGYYECAMCYEDYMGDDL